MRFEQSRRHDAGILLELVSYGQRFICYRCESPMRPIGDRTTRDEDVRERLRMCGPQEPLEEMTTFFVVIGLERAFSKAFGVEATPLTAGTWTDQRR